MNEDSIFADIPREGHETIEEVLDSVDKELQEETPAESQTENIEQPDLKQNETWKRLREERDAERQARAELEARLEKLESSRQADEPIEQPEYLTDLIGENPEVARKFRNYEETLKEQIKRELANEQASQAQAEQAEAQKWAKWTEERFAEVETEFKVNFKSDESLKNELAKIMFEYSPTDDRGNLDYRKGMKILNSLKAVDVKDESIRTQTKKNIADATVSKETSTKPNKDYLTNQDLRGGWRSMIDR